MSRVDKSTVLIYSIYILILDVRRAEIFTEGLGVPIRPHVLNFVLKLIMRRQIIPIHAPEGETEAKGAE